jgi:hypothetical protein
MSVSAAQHLVDEFNNGNWDEIESYFNEDFDLFMEYLTKYNLLDQIDFFKIDEEYQNKILLFRLEKYPEETLKFICGEILTDVHEMNGGYYVYLNNREELSKLFETNSRNYPTRDIVKSVLGEDWWEPYSDTTDDVYDDVIDKLNDDNLNYLTSYIVKRIGDQELSLDHYNDMLFTNFSEEQGTEGVFKINETNVKQLIGDKDAMKELLNNDLFDLKSDLYNIHGNAYNTAYSDEVYVSVWNELETFFIKGFEYAERELRNGKKVTAEYVKIRNFFSDVKDFLINNPTADYSTSQITYYGGYIEMIEGMMDNGDINYLSFRIPEYPSYTEVKKIINEIFGDYI